jgi:hypothetical protein
MAACLKAAAYCGRFSPCVTHSSTLWSCRSKRRMQGG